MYHQCIEMPTLGIKNLLLFFCVLVFHSTLYKWLNELNVFH